MTTYTATNLRDEALANLGIIQQTDTAATRTRADLVIESLSALGVVYQPDASATRTRAELVTETAANLGFNYQTDASAPRTRAEWVTETLHLLGIVQQTDASATRSRVDWVNETLQVLGVLQQTDASATRTRAEWVTEIMAQLGLTQQTDASATRTRADWVNETLSLLGVVQQTDGSSTVNRAALVNNVAFILGANSAGQTLSADDYAAIDIRIDTVIGDLNARAIATITASAIPGAWFDSVSIIVANVCKDKYGVTGDEAAKLQAEAVLAETKLKTLTRTGLVDEILPQIIGDLNARAVATVASIAAIPGAWFASLADIAAEHVKGKFDIPPQRSQEIAQRAKDAERKLRSLSGTAIVDEILPSLIGDLNARAVATISNIAAIPGAWFPSLADIGAEFVKGKFVEISAQRSQEIATRAKDAEAKLRTLTGTGMVDEALPQIIGDLNARGVATVASIAAIPGAWFTSLADIAAEHVKGKFSVPAQRSQEIAERAKAGEAKLRTLSAPALVDEALPSLIGELNARGIATVASIAAIPGAWFPSLAAISADYVKGKVGVSPDRAQQLAATAAIAERKLKAITQGPLIDEKLPSLIGELNARNIVTVTSLGAIPGASFSALADIAAESVKGKFEISAERSQEIAARAKLAEVNLKTLNRGPLVDAMLPSLMADLNARGVATVTLTAIPSAWFPSLADIVANAARGLCDPPADIIARLAANAQRAERTLKNLTRTYIVDRNIDGILASLAARKIVYLVDQTNIPQEWFIALAAIVANECKGKGFDLDPATVQRVAIEGAKAIADLREIASEGPAYLPMTGTYF